MTRFALISDTIMNVKVLLFLGLCSVFTTAFTSDFGSMPQSFGAPVSSTGAPEEVTCATSECHDTSVPNIGNAQTVLEIDGLNNGYAERGKTYTLTISISDKDVKRFGFQITALDSEGKSAGTFIVKDEERTQIIKNELRLTDREYVTYTYPGTAATVIGKSEWSVQWKAPADMKDVTFYLATVSANDDGTDKGDNVYTMSRTVQVQNVSGIYDEPTVHSTIAPNPLHGTMITLTLPNLPVSEETKYKIIGLNGKEFIPTAIVRESPTTIRFVLDDIPNGLYRLYSIGKETTISSSFIVMR